MEHIQHMSLYQKDRGITFRKINNSYLTLQVHVVSVFLILATLGLLFSVTNRKNQPAIKDPSHA